MRNLPDIKLEKIRKMYHVFGDDKDTDSTSYYLYHPYSQSIFSIDEDEAIILKIYESYFNNIKMVKQVLYGLFTNKQIDDVLSNTFEILSKLEPSKIEDVSEPEELIIIVSGACNMKCNYCYTLQGKIYTNTLKTQLLKFDKAKIAVDYILRKYPSITSITFFGGEPLLNFENLKKIVEYISKNHLQIKEFKMVINETLITKKIASFLDKYNIYTTISIDGSPVYNNFCRRMSSGVGSYDKIVKGIENIRECMENKFFIEATYTPLMAIMGVSPLQIAKFI